VLVIRLPGKKLEDGVIDSPGQPGPKSFAIAIAFSQIDSALDW